MFATASVTNAQRLLTAQSVAATLARYRMPSYSALAEMLGDMDVWRQATRLWKHFFPNLQLPHGDAWGLEESWLALCSSNLFPLSIAVDEMLYQTEDHPLLGTVDYESWGIAWEAGWSEIEAAARPLAAAVALGLSPAVGWDDAAFDFKDQATEYLTELGWAPLDEDGALQYGWIRTRLAALPAPFDGLATLYECLRRDSGNAFLDTIAIFYRAEFDDTDWFEWEIANIEELRHYWQAAFPKIDRLLAYGQWWETTPQAQEKVVEIVARALELTPMAAILETPQGDGQELYELFEGGNSYGDLC